MLFRQLDLENFQFSRHSERFHTFAIDIYRYATDGSGQNYTSHEQNEEWILASFLRLKFIHVQYHSVPESAIKLLPT